MSYIPPGSVPLACDPLIVISGNTMAFFSLLLIGWAAGYGTREIVNWISNMWRKIAIRKKN
jgi:hypothetical protein